MTIENIKKITIIGLGLMGHGIAQEFALAGYTVYGYARSDEKCEEALDKIKANLNRLQQISLIAKTEADPVMANLNFTTNLKEATADCDIVIEAVYEDLALKQSVFKKLDELCPPRTILASTTSTLLPSLLAKDTKRPDKVVVAHYFNPPYLLPLVEVVRSAETSDDTVNTMYTLLKKIGKAPALVQKEVPGFIGNRLQAALLREALSIVQQGIATAEDVDSVIKNSFGRRLAVAGIFEIFEIVGWDFILTAAGYVFGSIESSTELSPIVKEMVDRGDLGIKSGKGFYEWTPESTEAFKQRIAQGLVAIAQLQDKTVDH